VYLIDRIQKISKFINSKFLNYSISDTRNLTPETKKDYLNGTHFSPTGAAS